ncbi:hypothetical protein [Burkholderia anthina]|uniref:hypothetical protein n=1 Tax=Burkholderia anthina TaxID=179879 RepID=UPI0012DA55C1|nr:hypothetical protein [Burkholderia anthina]
MLQDSVWTPLACRVTQFKLVTIRNCNICHAVIFEYAISQNDARHLASVRPLLADSTGLRVPGRTPIASSSVVRKFRGTLTRAPHSTNLSISVSHTTPNEGRKKARSMAGLARTIFQILESHLPKLVTHQLDSAASA